jgi:iron(III) transport system ATP-binding protein
MLLLPDVAIASRREISRSMPTIALDRVSKSFRSTVAVDAVDLVVPAGSFVALLGPSGCGKTTLLRLIAGFETPSSGAIRFDDRIMAEGDRLVPPEERGVGMVFQSYALWPHMSVADNVAFPLKVKRLGRAEIGAKVGAALERVGLGGLGDRMPDALSGGQRQRVALARALIQETGIILADEPLANLDAHLRAAMVTTFADLHRATGRTFVYVTHDQAEALALASHVAVMDHGRIAQWGTPEAVYAAPANRTVARFIGRGAFLPGEVIGPDHGGHVPVRIAGGTVTARVASPASGKVTLLVRPEAVRPGGDIPVTVRHALFRGGSVEVSGVLADGTPIGFDWPNRPEVGGTLAVAIGDAWVIPEG